MYEVILFGGTTEGRKLASYLTERKIPSLVCVTTEYGAALLDCLPPVFVRSERLGRTKIAALLHAERPRLVIDATHPYAALVSENVRAACAENGLRCARVLRERADSGDCPEFPDPEALVAWLNRNPGVIFAATGAKEARALTGVERFEERIYLRILPSPDGIGDCLAMGYPMKHLICMQGPFSQELNTAMFREAGARILITKESGENGGFYEKLSAAKVCGMTTAILARPLSESGLTVNEAAALIREVCG